MNAFDFFSTLPSTEANAPIPNGKASGNYQGGKECFEGPGNCSNCDCDGVDDCKSECSSEC
jgi:hypothetical protein